MPKAQEHSKLQRWLFASTKKKKTHAKKCPKWTSKKRLVIFSSVFPPQTPKSGKTTAEWRILGGRRQGCPRVAKANAARYHKTRRSIAGFEGCRPRARRSWGGWQGAGWKARRNAWSWAQGDSENEKTTTWDSRQVKRISVHGPPPKCLPSPLKATYRPPLKAENHWLRTALTPGRTLWKPKTLVLHRRFYTQSLLHTNTFTHARFYTRTVLHTNTCFTQTLLHTIAFTHKHFYTQTLLHTDGFTHKHLFHTDAFTHNRFYTQALLHTDAFTHGRFYTQTLLHTNAFTHRRFYTQVP